MKLFAAEMQPTVDKLSFDSGHRNLKPEAISDAFWIIKGSHDAAACQLSLGSLIHFPPPR
jgi:hypothetical protein